MNFLSFNSWLKVWRWYVFNINFRLSLHFFPSISIPDLSVYVCVCICSWCTCDVAKYSTIDGDNDGAMMLMIIIIIWHICKIHKQASTTTTTKLQLQRQQQKKKKPKSCWNWHKSFVRCEFHRWKFLWIARHASMTFVLFALRIFTSLHQNFYIKSLSFAFAHSLVICAMHAVKSFFLLEIKLFLATWSSR